MRLKNQVKIFDKYGCNKIFYCFILYDVLVDFKAVLLSLIIIIKDDFFIIISVVFNDVCGTFYCYI